MYEEWFHKTITAHEAAGSFAWMLVVRRDQRIPFVFFPYYLKKSLRQIGAFEWEGSQPLPSFSLRAEMNSHGMLDISGMTLEHFFRGVGRDHIERLARVA
jgi:hypothetical protein